MLQGSLMFLWTPSRGSRALFSVAAFEWMLMILTCCIVVRLLYSAMKKIEEQNTLVFLVDRQANKRQIKQAVKTLYDVQAAKINTLIRCVAFIIIVLPPLCWRWLVLLFVNACSPDGKKKAYVKLTPEVDALDIANKIGFI
jgi:large subunit ribosomal protein L23Ae